MDSFEARLTAIGGAVDRFVRFRIPSPEDAEDILQSVYLTGFEKYSQLKNKDAFKAWMFSIAKNQCNAYFRKKVSCPEISLDEFAQTESHYSRSGLTETSIVQDTLDQLNDQDRQILALFFWQELPQAEIAAQLGIPLGTVKSRLHTAKQHFKNSYPYTATLVKGASSMKKLPQIMPAYTIKKSDQPPFSVVWEELWGLFIVPRLGETKRWGIYETDTKTCSEWSEMEVIGHAMIHGAEGVEIHENRHFSKKQSDTDHRYIAQLTETHCRMLAESYTRNGVRKHLTFLDGDDFLEDWGYGENNCGKETHQCPAGRIKEIDSVLHAENTEQLCDIVGRYTVTIGNKSYDTIRLLSLDAFHGDHIATEQYLDMNGNTVLWRRFNRDDWAGQCWTERLPNNEQLHINGNTYVHWYDCITDYIL